MTCIILKKSELLATLRLANEITKHKSTNPITQAITLETDGHTIFMRAFDFECHLGTCLDGRNRSDGEISVQALVNAKAFAQMIQSLERENVALHCEEGGKVLVEDDDGNNLSLISDLKYEDFPLWKGMHGKPNATLKLADLVAALEQAAVAMAPESTRFAIAGVLLKLGADGILAVATDGHRLAKATATATVKKKAEIVLPSSAIRLLHSVKADKDTEVEIRIESDKTGENTRACFSWNSTELLVKGENKAFPSYDRVIPADPKHCAKVKKSDLQKAVCRAFSGRAHKAPVSRMKFEGQEQASVSVVVNDAGSELTTRLPVSYSGGAIEFTVNANFIREYLAVLPSEELEVKIASADRPIALAGINPPGRFEYYCMPLTA